MFRDRSEAGIDLAEKLKDYADSKEVLVLALPRGGVVTGFEIARRLNVLLDVLIVRKIGHPLQRELAIGAVSETGTVFLNRGIISTYRVSNEYIDDEISRQKEEISRRIHLYRKGKPIRELKGKTIILVDDGVATGATIKAAIETLKKEKINKLIAAVPVAPPDTAKELESMADEFICLETPLDFMAVGNYYQDFTQVSDGEVVDFLQKAEKKK
ncbi:MAG: phosphoribosyltransferase [Nitrospirae bacterium]|nr:phosphoribosyltransferase [Nitrospirota bacterium]